MRMNGTNYQQHSPRIYNTTKTHNDIDNDTTMLKRQHRNDKKYTQNIKWVEHNRPYNIIGLKQKEWQNLPTKAKPNTIIQCIKSINVREKAWVWMSISEWKTKEPYTKYIIAISSSVVETLVEWDAWIHNSGWMNLWKKWIYSIYKCLSKN